MNNLQQHIGSQIRSKRTQQGLSMKDLGEKIGSKKAYISNIENAHQTCSLRKLQEIAGALGCEVKVEIE